MRKIFFIAVVFTLLVSCGKTIDNPAANPTDKLSNNWWKERHEMVIEKNKSNPQLILLGNSILNTLDNKDREVVWGKYLNKYNTVNMGFSGDRTENLIWRLQNGEIDKISPKVALLLIGTNNTDGNHYLDVTQPEELAGGIWEICKIVREKLPDTEILLLGIFPYGYKPNYRDNINKATNKIIAKFPTKDTHINYRNIGDIFVDDNKNVMKSLMPDYLHPNTEGHLLMFETIKNDIEKLMKQK